MVRGAEAADSNVRERRQKRDPQRTRQMSRQQRRVVREGEWARKRGRGRRRPLK